MMYFLIKERGIEMHKKNMIVLLLGLISALSLGGCRITDINFKNESKKQEQPTYSPEELKILEKDGLSAGEIEELNELNQDIEMEDIKEIISEENSALTDELLDIAMVTNIENFCYQTDGVLEGFDVELASEIAELISVDFQMVLHNSIEDCFGDESVDCIILNTQINEINGHAYSDEYMLDRGTYV